MRQLIAAFTIALIGAFAAWAGTDYHDPEGRFRVTVPDGWASQRLTGTPIALAMASDRIKETGALCIVLAQNVPETRSMQQSDLDEAFGPMLNEEFWLTMLKSVKVPGSVTLESSGTEPRQGRTTYFVISKYTRPDATGEQSSKSKMVLHVVPGSMHFINCLTKYDQYAQEEANLEVVFASYAPGSGLIASLSPRGPSLLKLYAGPRFDGVNLDVKGDVANLAQLGWRGNTASFSVSGYGQWQICDGVDYSGNCRMVATPSAAALGGRVLRIASVRRYADPRDVRNAAGLVADAAALQLNAAVEHSIQRSQR